MAQKCRSSSTGWLHWRYTIDVHFRWKCTLGAQNIASTHRSVLEDKNPGSIGREVRRRKDGAIRKVLAAGKRNGGRKANKHEKTLDEREFPYPSCGCGIIPTLSAGTELCVKATRTYLPLSHHHLRSSSIADHASK